AGSFTIEVTKISGAEATGVTVYDILPNGYTYESDSSGGDYNPTTGFRNIGTISDSNPVTLTINATVNFTGQYFNNASVYANEPDNNYANNSAQSFVEPFCETRALSPKSN